jgi:hypothetical protein
VSEVKHINIEDLSTDHPLHPVRLTHGTVVILRELIHLDTQMARDVLFGAFMETKKLIPKSVALTPLELYFGHGGNWSRMAEHLENDWQGFAGDVPKLRETSAAACADFIVEHEQARVRASAS